MTRSLSVKQRQARNHAIESRRNQRRDEPEYRSLFEWLKSTFDGRFEELCHFATGCALDQKRLVSEYKLMSYELADIKDKANLFSQHDNPNVTHRTKFAVAELLIKGEFDGPIETAFMAGASASKRRVAESGGNTRASKFSELQRYATEQFSARYRSGSENADRTRVSTAEAARQLWPEIHARSRVVGPQMAEVTGPKTLYGWLRKHEKNMR
jgi:hypothetical protein